MVIADLHKVVFKFGTTYCGQLVSRFKTGIVGFLSINGEVTQPKAKLFGKNAFPICLRACITCNSMAPISRLGSML